ncbi:MAG: radical SAM protein [Crocinitomicaceae bacterium]|nr:radical SAM protein [Crocinitomicaceae bacterium]
MATFLFDAHVFGPIKSRRLGSSLGLNLLSTQQKVCNFDCVYCECGLTHSYKENEALYVDEQEFIQQLEDRLKVCKVDKTPIDAITFAGNGEPTLHPNFATIIDQVVELRNQFFPNASIAVLTNGVTLKNSEIETALTKVDKAIVKLDAGTSEDIKQIDQPKRTVNVDALIDLLQKFKGPLHIQTMFLKGTVNGQIIDNTSGDSLKSWLSCIERIAPKEVMLYSLDRDTPIETLEAVTKKELEAIAKKVEAMNILTQVV